MTHSTKKGYIVYWHRLRSIGQPRRRILVCGVFCVTVRTSGCLLVRRGTTRKRGEAMGERDVSRLVR